MLPQFFTSAVFARELIQFILPPPPQKKKSEKNKFKNQQVGLFLGETETRVIQMENDNVKYIAWYLLLLNMDFINRQT